MKREYDLRKGKRGPVLPMPPEKVRITIRLDRDIVDHFRDQVRNAHRGNYQTLINEALREHIKRPGLAEQVGAQVRSVVREEFQKNKAERLNADPGSRVARPRRASAADAWPTQSER